MASAHHLRTVNKNHLQGWGTLAHFLRRFRHVKHPVRTLCLPAGVGFRGMIEAKLERIESSEPLKTRRACRGGDRGGANPIRASRVGPRFHGLGWIHDGRHPMDKHGPTRLVGLVLNKSNTIGLPCTVGIITYLINRLSSKLSNRFDESKGNFDYFL